MRGSTGPLARRRDRRRPALPRGTIPGAILAAALLILPARAQSGSPGFGALRAEPETALESPDEPLLRLHGSLVTNYRVRWTGEDTDQDLDQYIRVEGGPASGDVTGALYVRVHGDLDSHGDSEGYTVFEDLWDTWDGRIQSRLYYGYLDFHRIPGTELARVGRMLLYETPAPFHVDGVYAESMETGGDLRLRFGGYGGIPVHLYESSASGDSIVGGFAASRPWSGGQLRFDATHIEDEADDATEEDDLLGFAIEQRFAPRLGLALRHTRLDGESRDLEARADWIEPELGFQAQLRWYDQPTTLHAATPELDPFSSALHDLAPHQLIGGVAHQQVGDHITVSLGYDERILEDQGDESPFNHEYSRGSATFAWQDWPWEGTAGFVTGDRWNSTGDDTENLSGEISQEFAERLRARLGSIYSRYEYDYLLQAERDEVRTFYLALEGPLEGANRFRIEYEYERDPFDEYHVVLLRYTHDF